MATVTNVQVTNRTARFLRPADGMERVFRNATIVLAKKHAFARSLVNTGRMAVANPYSHSPLTAPDLPMSFSVQNVGFSWADGSAGRLNQLLQWVAGMPLLLLWADAQQALSPKVLKELQTQASSGHLRCALVYGASSGATQHASVREHLFDKRDQISQACGFTQKSSHGAWALIRGDSYLAARGEALTPHVLQASLSRLQAKPSAAAGARA